MNNYKQLVEFIINDETDKARELFHTIVVEKSRDIFESLIDDDELAGIGGNAVEELANDIELDEAGLSEEEEDASEFDMDDADMDFDHDGETDDHETAHIDDDERITNLEDALDELKAEFDALMADEEAEVEGDDEFSDAEEGDDEFDDSIVREYVEKVAAPSNTATKSKSPVAGKNDMGGTAKNLVQGGEETSVQAKKPQDMKTGNINVPGGKAGAAFSTKEKAKTTESRKRR